MTFDDEIMRYYVGTRKAYDRYKADNRLDPNGCYFITDTAELMFEDQNYNHAFIFYTGDLPKEPTPNKIYFNIKTLATHLWDGTRWCDVFGPGNATYISSNPAILPTNANITGEVVADYTERLLVETMNELITLKTFKYNNQNNYFTITIGNSTKNISLNSIATNITVNEDGYTLELRDNTGAILDSKRLYPCNIVNGTFNTETLTIDFYYSDDSPVISIPIDRVFNLMLSDDTTSIDVSISENDRSFLQMDVKISHDPNNELTLYPDGLYASWTRFIDKVDDPTPGSVLEVREDGYAKTSHGITTILTNDEQKNTITEQAVNQGLNEVLESYWRKEDSWTDEESPQKVLKSLRVCSANT